MGIHLHNRNFPTSVLSNIKPLSLRLATSSSAPRNVYVPGYEGATFMRGKRQGSAGR